MTSSGALETALQLDRRIKATVARGRMAEAETAAILRELKRRRLYRELGYPRIQDYAEGELDISPSKAKDLIEIASRVVSLPLTRDLFETGELPWTKARAVVRVATPETEEEWLRKARTLSNRALEAEVARAKGQEPQVVVVLKLTPAEAADLDLAVKRIREERGEGLALGSAVAEACRRSLGPPIERPGYQIVIQECPSCGAASRDAGRESVEVPSEELAAAKEDAMILDLTVGGTGTCRKTIKPSERRAVIARDHGRCALCGTSAWLHIHHVERIA
jgi:hypothetical protein